MREVLNAIDEWRAGGHRVAIATVTKVKGSAPRPPGAKMAISDDGRWIGSVSVGCVEVAVLEVADMTRDGEGPFPREAGEAVGVRWESVRQVIRSHQRGALVTVIDGKDVGAKLLVTATATEGSLSDAALDAEATATARELLPDEESAVRAIAGRQL